MTVQQRPPSAFYPLASSADWGGRSTRAEINLEAIARNVRAIRSFARSRELMAVVKADAYGHGAPAIARTALDNGASWLGVYTVDEGTELRRAGVTAPILVFGPFQSLEAGDIVRHRLTPVVGSLQAAVSLQVAAMEEPIPFHFKIDTGLNRSGVNPSEALPLLEAISALPALHPQGIFTHFARSDEPSSSETDRQLRRFLDAVDHLERAGYRFDLRHAANTGATLSAPATHLDLVRCGIGIYGYYPSKEVARGVALTPALSLATSVTRIHILRSGAGVGYAHEFVCPRQTRLALAPIGYGDGLPRTLGLGIGSVIIRGRTAAIVGRVSMDQITIDVTDIPDAEVGDDVILIGVDGDLERSADDVALAAGTISYDVLSGIMPRVPRLYARAGALVTRVPVSADGS
jgi:alanine racemase